MKTKFIKTEDYLLLVDMNHRVKPADLVVFSKTKDDIANPKNIGTVEFIMDTTVTVSISDFTITIPKLGRYKPLKIIAHLPLNNAPILEGVDLLPSFEELDTENLGKVMYDKLAEGLDLPILGKPYWVGGFQHGYKAAQAKQFTIDDMKYCWEKAIESIQSSSLPEFSNFKEFIQQIQQPKSIIDFIPEIEYYYHSSKEFYIQPFFIKCSKEQYESIKREIPKCPVKLGLKTITNSQGQKVVKGKYLFE